MVVVDGLVMVIGSTVVVVGAVVGGIHFVQIGIGAGFETQIKMPDFNVDKI